MGLYRVAQICPNGHVATDSADVRPELREEHCSTCGEKTIMACPHCQAPIRGDYYVENVVSIGFTFTPPAFCHKCGKAFPWTERGIANAIELLECASELEVGEIQQFKQDLIDLAKDSPRTPVAALRIKKLLAKAGTAVTSAMRDITISLLSEAARKALWGA